MGDIKRSEISQLWWILSGVNFGPKYLAMPEYYFGNNAKPYILITIYGLNFKTAKI